MSDDRAGTGVAAVQTGLALQNAGGEMEMNGRGTSKRARPPKAEPEFTPVSVDSLLLVLDGLRRIGLSG
jgi:hypothetical protein